MFNLSAQQLHGPLQIVDIMKKSTINYEVDTLLHPIQNPTYKLGGQRMNKYVKFEDADEILLEVPNPNYNGKLEKLVSRATAEIEKGKENKARKCLLQAQDIRPSDPRVTNGLAKVYFNQKDYESALYWYERTLEFNAIDTDALVGSANCNSSLNEQEKAVKNITLAHLYNRNDTEIIKVLEGIYQKFGIKYLKKDFVPQYIVTPKKANTVKIRYGHSVWMAYAAVKAVWQNEPKFAEIQARLSEQAPDIIQEKEALLNALITYEKLDDPNKNKKFPFMNILSGLTGHPNMIDIFIHYEINSRKDNQALMLMTEEELQKFVEYLTVHRAKL